MTQLLVEKFKRDVAKRNRMYRFLLVADQMLNVVVWNGSQDETISSHVGRRIEEGKATWIEYKLCFFLQWLETSHCIKSKGE